MKRVWKRWDKFENLKQVNKFSVNTLEQYLSMTFELWYDERIKHQIKIKQKIDQTRRRNYKKKIESYSQSANVATRLLCANREYILRCHVAIQAHVYLAINCRAATRFYSDGFFSYWLCVYIKLRLYTSLQFTKCELRNVISISDSFLFHIRMHIARLHSM